MSHLQHGRGAPGLVADADGVLSAEPHQGLQVEGAGHLDPVHRVAGPSNRVQYIYWD